MAFPKNLSLKAWPAPGWIKVWTIIAILFTLLLMLGAGLLLFMGSRLQAHPSMTVAVLLTMCLIPGNPIMAATWASSVAAGRGCDRLTWFMVGLLCGWGGVAGAYVCRPETLLRNIGVVAGGLLLLFMVATVLQVLIAMGMPDTLNGQEGDLPAADGIGNGDGNADAVEVPASSAPLARCRAGLATGHTGYGTLADLASADADAGLGMVCRELMQAWSRVAGLRYGVDFGDCELLKASQTALPWLQEQARGRGDDLVYTLFEEMEVRHAWLTGSEGLLPVSGAMSDC